MGGGGAGAVAPQIYETKLFFVIIFTANGVGV